MPFWSLSTEVEFYLLVPLFVLLARRLITRRWHLAAGFVGVVAFGVHTRWLSREGGMTTFLNFITNLDVFLIGGLVCAGIYGFKRKRDKRSERLKTSLVAGLILFPVLSLYDFALARYDSYLFAPTVTAVLTALFIWTSEGTERGEYVKSVYSLRQVVARPSLILAYIGALSYGIYLWHMSILMKVQDAGTIGGGGWKAITLRFILTAALAAACSIWTYRYIENRPATESLPSSR